METRHSYESAYPAITDVLSEETHNLAVLYGSTTGNEWRALAFQTNLVTRRTEYAEINTISDGETVDFGIIQEDGHSGTGAASTDSSSDRLRIDDNRSETIVEWGIGVTPDDVLVGLENPSGVDVHGVQGDRGRGWDADSLDTHGGVLSQNTMYDEDVPTTALSPNASQGVVRIDSDEDGSNPIRVGFKNISDGEATIEVIAHGAAYHVTPITDKDVVEEYVFGDGVNRRTLTWGGPENTSPNIPDEWKDGRITLTSEDVRSIV